jgi:hypothetical protein
MEVGSYDILLLLHIVLLGYWIGSDLCVNLLAERIARAGALPGPESDRSWALLQALSWHPRTALILTMTIGFTLAAQLGLARLDNAALATLWIGALAWWVLARPRWAGSPAATDTTRVTTDWELRSRQVLALTFAFIGVQSLVTDGPLAARWLAIKVLLFAAVIVCGIIVRQQLQSAADTSRRLAASAAETTLGQAAVARSITSARRWSQVSWALLLLIAWFGVMKPGSP